MKCFVLAVLAGDLFNIGLSSAAHGEDARPIVFLKQWGERGSEPGEFDFPHGVAFDRAGCLYVVDAYNHRILKFDVGRQKKD